VQFEGGILVEIGVEHIRTDVKQVKDGIDDINKVRIRSLLRALN